MPRSRKIVRRRRKRAPLVKAPAKSRQKFLVPLKYTGLVSTDGAGTIALQCSPATVSTGGNYSAISGLYDSFAVKAMKLQIIPRYMDGGQGVGGATYSRGTLMSLVDEDGTNLPTTIAQALQCGSMKYRNPCKPFKMYSKIPKRLRPQMNDFNVGWNTQNKSFSFVILGDSWSNSVEGFYYLLTWYVTCYGLR